MFERFIHNLWIKGLDFDLIDFFYTNPVEKYVSLEK